MITHSDVGTECTKEEFLSITRHSGNVSHVTKIVAASNSLDTSKADYLCDGTNDEVQIDAAIDAVYASGGGTVFLLEGLYSIGSPPVVHDNVTLEGTGFGTQLKKNDVVELGSVISAFGSNICIRNLYIHGNLKYSELTVDAVAGDNHVHVTDVSAYSDGMGITIYVRTSSSESHQENLTIDHISGDALYFTTNLVYDYDVTYGEEECFIYNRTTANIGIGLLNTNSNVLIDKVWITKCLVSAIYGVASNLTIQNNFLHDCQSDLITHYNAATAATIGLNILNNHMYNSYQYDCLNINQYHENVGSITSVRIIGNQFFDYAHHAVDFKADDTYATISNIIVSGNLAIHGGDWLNMEGDTSGAEVPGGCFNAIVAGNVGNDFISFALRMDAMEKCVLSGNVMSGCDGSSGAYSTFYVRKGTRNCIFSSNVLVANESASGFYLAGGGYNVVTGNIIMNNDDYGLQLESQYNTVTGNICSDNQGSPTQDYGIYVKTSDATGNIIQNNITRNNVSYGISENSTCAADNVYDYVIKSVLLPLETDAVFPVFTAQCPCMIIGYSVVHTWNALTDTDYPIVLIGKIASGVDDDDYFDTYTLSCVGAGTCLKGTVHNVTMASMTHTVLAKGETLTAGINENGYLVVGTPPVYVVFKIALMSS